MFGKGRTWLAYPIVFVGSTCTMVVEMIAGRLMAPYIGVSLYTWTSIIGIVLAGMSLGNYLGGVVADRRASRTTLGLIFVAGGVAALGILVMTRVAIGAGFSASLSLIPKIVFYTTTVFFLPSLVLGMVSPVVVKLALRDLEHSGNTVGSIYAFSTVGSIFGTFVTGFYLISWLGTRTIVWLVAVVLLLMGVALGEFWRPKARLATLGGTLLACGVAYWANASGALVWLTGPVYDHLGTVSAAVVVALPVITVVGAIVAARGGTALAAAALVAYGVVYVGWGAGLYQAPCQVESNYYCIRISEQVVDGKPARALVLDHLIHSYVSPKDPTALGYGYERIYAELTQFYVRERSATGGAAPLDTLFIGGGGYTFPRYVEAVYPSSTIDVLEIDPAVTAAAREYLELPPDSRIRTFNGDARSFLIQWPDPKRYDIVYGDAFNDLSVPYHLTTREFGQVIASRLKDDGVYMANVIDKYNGGEFVKAFINALKPVFPHVYLLSQGEAWRGTSSNTWIVLASRRPFDQARFHAVVGADGANTTALPDAELEAYLKSGRALTLTDDFAPVDQLVARLFIDRGY